MISRDIMMVWDDFKSIPQPISVAVNGAIKNNSAYRIIKADDRFVSKIIKDRYGGLVQRIYEKNRIAASRSDMARQVLLHEFGGFYVDAGMGLQKSLDYMRGKGSLVLVHHDTMAAFARCPQRLLL